MRAVCRSRGLRYKRTSMVIALLRALFALVMPPLRRVVALGLGLSAMAFALLWFVIAAVLYRTNFFTWRPLD